VTRRLSDHLALFDVSPHDHAPPMYALPEYDRGGTGGEHTDGARDGEDRSSILSWDQCGTEGMYARTAASVRLASASAFVRPALLLCGSSRLGEVRPK
jgi:hypothetical protein